MLDQRNISPQEYLLKGRSLVLPPLTPRTGLILRAAITQLTSEMESAEDGRCTECGADFLVDELHQDTCSVVYLNRVLIAIDISMNEEPSSQNILRTMVENWKDWWSAKHQAFQG